jgi:hypothetical protein
VITPTQNANIVEIKKKKDGEWRDQCTKLRKCIVCREKISNETNSSNMCDLHALKKSEYDRNRIRDDTSTNHHRIKEYVKNSKRRDLIFDLTYDLTLSLLLKKCTYCGIYESAVNKYGEAYSPMGIDRKDNNIGYLTDNVVTSCKVCNRLKYTHTYDDFFTYLLNIFEHYGSEESWDENDNIKVIPYRIHKGVAKSNNRPTELTKEEYTTITSKKCYYCNCLNLQQLNIDRVDSTIGYTKKNKLVSCCSICNIMKCNMHVDDFYNKILEILLNHGHIEQTTFKAKRKIVKQFSSKIKQVNNAICKIYDYNGKENKDRRNIHNFDKPSQYYIDQI